MNSAGMKIDPDALAWKKAERSGFEHGSGCVAVATWGALVAIHDDENTNPEAPIIVLNSDEWDELVAVVNKGLDLPDGRMDKPSATKLTADEIPKNLQWAVVGTGLEVAIFEDGVAVRDAQVPGKEALVFSDMEWEIFVDGVRKGEFAHLPGADVTAGIGAVL